MTLSDCTPETNHLQNTPARHRISFVRHGLIVLLVLWPLIDPYRLFAQQPDALTSGGDVEAISVHEIAKRQKLLTEREDVWLKGDLEQSIRLTEELFELESKIYGPVSAQVAWRLREKATYTLEFGEVDSALRAVTQSSKIVTELYSEDSWQVEDAKRFEQMLIAISDLPFTQRMKLLNTERDYINGLLAQELRSALEAVRERARLLQELLGERHLAVQEAILRSQELLILLNDTNVSENQLRRLGSLIPQISKTPNLVYALYHLVSATHAINSGEVELAEERYRQAIRLYEESGLLFHLDYAVTVNNYGQFLMRVGRYIEAREVLTKAQSLLRNQVGLINKKTRLIEYNLVNLEIYLGTQALRQHQWETCEDYLKHALQTLERIESETGDDQYLIRDLTSVLEVLKRCRGMSPEELQSFDRCLAVGDRAETETYSGQSATALESSREYRDLVLKIFGDNNPSTIRAKFLVAKHTRDGDRKRELLESLREQSAQIFGEHHPKHADLLIEIADWSSVVNAETLALAEQAISIYRNSSWQETWEYAHALRIVGRIKNALQHQDAIDSLLESYGYWKRLRLTTGIEYLLTLNEILHYHFRERDYLEALPYCENAVELARQFAETQPLLAAQTCNQVATTYEVLERLDEALQNYLRAIKLFEGLSDPPGIAYLITLKNVAGLYARRQEFVSAETYYRRFLKLVEEPRLYNRSLQINAILSLSLLYNDLERYDESHDLLKQIASVLEQEAELSVDWLDIRLAEINLAQISDNPERAILLFEELWKVLQGGPFPPNPEATTIGDPAEPKSLPRPEVLTQQEWWEYLERLKFLTQEFSDPRYQLRVLHAISEAVREIKETSPWRFLEAGSQLREAETLAQLSADQQTQLDKVVSQETELVDEWEDEANLATISKLREVITRKEEILGPQHSSVAESYLQLAEILQESGRINSAVKAYQQAIDIRRELWGEQHQETAAAKSAGSMAALAAGDVRQAERWLTEAIQTQTEILGENHPDLAESYHRLARYHGHLGNYAEALELAQSTCRRYAFIYGTESLERAEALRTLSMVYSAIGSNLKAAYGSLLEAMSIVQSLSIDPDEEYEFLLTAAIQLSESSFAHAGVLEELDNMIAKFELSQPISEHHATALEIKGNIRIEQSRYQEAYEDFLRSLQIREKVYDQKNHPKIAKNYTGLGLASLKLGQLSRAEEYLSKAYEFNSQVAQVQEGVLILNVYSLAEVKARLGQPEESLKYLNRCFEIDEQSLMSNLVLRPEDALTKLLDERENMYSLLLTLHLSGLLSNDSAEFALSRILGRKGLALDVACQLSAAQNALIHDDSIVSKLTEIQRLRNGLAESEILGEDLAAETIGENGVFAWNEKTIIILRIQELQEQVAFEVRGSGLKLQTTGVDIAQVRQRLAPNSALIEFVVSGVIDLEDPTSNAQANSHLLVFFLPSNADQKCRLVDLGPINEIDPLVEEMRTHIERVPRSLRFMAEADLEKQFQQISSELFKRLLQPLEAELSELQSVVIAPDSKLHLVPFAALWQQKQSRYLIEELAISYVSSGRDLLREKAPVGQGTLVLADPDYDASRKQRLEMVQQFGRESSPETALALRGTSEIDLRSLRWRPLPGAREEAADVQRVLGQSIYSPVQAFLGEEAVEEIFKTVVTPRIIHIATHGFYVPYQNRDESEMSSSSMDGSSGSALGRLRYTENPLMRSGLVLAGANQLAANTGEREFDLEDGWLTAQEISSMDFRNTELIVLSACESGLGDTESGHGVYGLRRAFLIAGAHSLLTSMFEVPDDETRQLMNLFYQRFVKHGDQVIAMQQTQQQMISDRRMSEEAAHPFFWASFFIVGSPTSGLE